MKPTTNIPYVRISLFFVLLLLVITWGFYKTYLIFFPSFKGFTMVHHFHGAMMMTWMAVLIVQPLLIRSGRVPLHRLIGKLSFVIAPLVVISIFLAAKTGFYRSELSQSYYERITGLALPIPSMLAFALFYVLAILNRRQTYHHMRYMIGTALLMIGPGLGRALITYFNVPFPIAINIIWYVAVGIALVLMLNDLFRKRSYLANTIVLTGIMLCLLAWMFRYSPIWTGIGEFIANNLF